LNARLERIDEHGSPVNGNSMESPIHAPREHSVVRAMER
jgi:hypothetical protein